MGRKRKVSVDEIAAMMEARGLTARQLDELLRAKEQPVDAIEIERRIKGTYRFGLISDSHLVDKGYMGAALTDFYKKCASLGITEVFHAGDLLTGQGVYPGQLQDLVCFGADEHLDYAVNNYPCVKGPKGQIVTYAIGGNHEESYIKNFGIDLLKALAEKRADIKYLGMYSARIRMSNGLLIQLQHGARGAPYAISYQLQRYITNIAPGQKPNIFLLGHYHSALYMVYRNISAFLGGCWQQGNMFTARLGLQSTIGGFICTVDTLADKRNSIHTITPTFVAYYPKENE